jgi:hypothetical protein
MPGNACLDCGLVLLSGTRCGDCHGANDRRIGPRVRGNYDSPAYRKARARLIGLPCVLQLPGCLGIADQADHILGGAEGPLQPACHHCNSKRRHDEAREARMRANRIGPRE